MSKSGRAALFCRDPDGQCAGVLGGLSACVIVYQANTAGELHVTTMTIRLGDAVKDKLEQLADATPSQPVFSRCRAIREYVRSQ